ncbi:MAG: quinolinate synthase NadA [Bacteroidales bacterium]|nr:quinolinate synthase NadA [Bacteroidales bacterium]
MTVNKTWQEKGYIDEPIPDGIDLVAEIESLKKQKNAVLMAHYYQTGDIQDIADIIGDSLALAQKAVGIEADIILLAGVHFMGETVKILNPNKKVLVPDLNAGCSLADSCQPADFARFLAQHPDHKVISYVNTSAEIKAMTDVVVTSTNALKVVDSFPKDEKIIFGPDRNLGSYINAQTGRQMLLWDGACHVHEQFSLEKILELKKLYPDAELIAHPECKHQVIVLADFVGSTAALLSHIGNSNAKRFIVATESGILHQMRKSFPDRELIAAPPMDSTCACNNCNFMKLNTLQKIYLTLKYEWPEVTVDPEIAEKARRPIDAMLALSKAFTK